MRYLITCVALLLMHLDADACSCVAIDIESHFKTQNFVFTAQLTASTDIRQGNRYLVQSDFKVIEAFKGDISKIPYILSDSQRNTEQTSCDWFLKKGEKYLFFIDNANNPRPHYCAGSRTLQHAKAELKQLRKLKK